MNDLFAIFDSCPIGMLVLDENVVITLVNDSCVALLGKERDHIIGKRFGNSFCCKGSIENERGCGFGEMCQSCEAREAIFFTLNTQQPTVNLECKKTLTKDGKELEVWLQVSTAPIMVNGKTNVVVYLMDITDRKLREIREQAAKEYYIQLLENFPTLIWRSGLDKKCDYFNKSWLSFTGRTLEQEMGDGWAEGVHPDDLEVCVKTYIESFDKRQPFEMEYRLRRFDGEYRWILDAGSPFYDLKGDFAGYIGSVYDITERKVAETALKENERAINESREKYHSLLMNMANGFSYHKVIFDGEGKPADYTFIEVNDIYLDIIGGTRDEVVGKNVTEVIPSIKKLSQSWIDICAKIATTGEPLKLDSHYSEAFARWYSIYIYSPAKGYFAAIYTDITERKLAEDAIRQSHEKYEFLFNNMIDGFTYNELLLNKDGKPVDYILLEANKSYQKFTGIKREDVIGKRASEIYNVGIQPEWLEKCYDAAYHGKSYSLENVYSNLIGRWYSTTIYSPKKGYFATMFNDATDRVKAMFALQESNAKYQSLLMNMNSGFGYFKVTFDENNIPVDCIYIEINKMFESFINLPNSEVVGKSILDVFPFNKKLLNRFMQDLKEVAFEGSSYKINELYMEDLDKWCSIFAYSPEKGYFAIILNDITVEHESKELMKKAKEQAEAASRAKSEFLANMSHEIRTPLNGVVGMIDLTLTAGLAPIQAENLSIAKNCANSLLEIINDILDFSKMEAGKLKLVRTNFNIKQLIEDIVKAHSPGALEKQIELNFMYSSGIPEYLAGDPNRLRQILNNLINNAIKFTEEGSITISVKMSEINNEDVILKFAVADTGIGIAHNEIDKLFKSFSQVDGSHTRKYGGTGLGLAISKQLIELMDGMIWLNSEKGEGSTFYFTVKLKKGQCGTIEKKEPSKLPFNNKALHILLVEDDYVNQTVISRILENRGYKLDVANNGIEALSLHEQNDYDAILMDIQMPEMDGIEATQFIREREGDLKHTPVIALTAYALEGDRERFLSKGMDDYISKPVAINQLVDALNRVSSPKWGNEFDVEGIRLSENGQVVFVGGNNCKLDGENRQVFKAISQGIAELEEILDKGDLSSIERTAKRIKTLSNRIEADEFKNSAFKIELAARRGDLKEAVKQSLQLGYEFETFKKTIS